MLHNKKGRILYILAFTLFILSALYGLLIRFNFVFPIDSFRYKNFLQSHSHVAFLGWGYIATVGALMHNFLSVVQRKRSIYKITLIIIITSIILMLISFPLMGYKVFSIALLSVFGITSYVLSYQLLKDIKGNSAAIKLVRFGIYYYLLSSLATWFLAGVLVTQGKTELYYNTVYFYLHFLYNGYFVFVLFGLLFKIFENKKVIISKQLQNVFFVYLNIACIPAYALSILWSKVSVIFNVIGFAASILQLISLLFLIKIVQLVLKQLKWNTISKLLLKFGLITYCLKIVIQVLSSFPYFVEKSLALKPFLIIGYLHLFTLGFMSVFIFLILSELNKIRLNSSISKIGVYTFLVGVLLTEFMLFFQGFLLLIQSSLINNYNLLLLLASIIIVIGLLLILSNQFQKTKKILI